MGAGELGQVGRMRIDQPGRERGDDTRREQLHETTQHHEVGLPGLDLLQDGIPPAFPVGEIGQGHGKSGNAMGLGVRETVRVPVGPDGNHPGRKLRILRHFEQRVQVRSPAGDEHDQ